MIHIMGTCADDDGDAGGTELRDKQSSWSSGKVATLGELTPASPTS